MRGRQDGISGETFRRGEPGRVRARIVPHRRVREGSRRESEGQQTPGAGKSGTDRNKPQCSEYPVCYEAARRGGYCNIRLMIDRTRVFTRRAHGIRVRYRIRPYRVRWRRGACSGASQPMLRPNGAHRSSVANSPRSACARASSSEASSSEVSGITVSPSPVNCRRIRATASCASGGRARAVSTGAFEQFGHVERIGF